jgi:hypothetical protein
MVERVEMAPTSLQSVGESLLRLDTHAHQRQLSELE